MKETLFVRRNVPECMGAAWTLMSTNIARVARALWLPSLVLALTSAFLATLSAFGLGSGTRLQVALWLFLASLAVVLASITLDAKIFKLVNEQTGRFCFSRAVKAFGVHLSMVLAATVAAWALASTDVWLSASGTLSAPVCVLLFLVEMAVLAALMLVFFSPMIYALTKYMVEPPMTLRELWPSYRTGLRSVGFIVAFYLLCAVVSGIGYSVIALPAVIATGAAAMSASGVAAGDESGLPANFAALYAGTIFVTSFVVALLRLWSLFAAYYMYASIEAKNGRTDDAEENES